MSAFGVTAEFVTSDFGVTTGVTVSIPLDAITLADKPVRASSGGSALIPVNTVAWLSKTPRLSAGARANIPVQSLSWIDKAPRITGGRSVYIPKDTPLSWSDKSVRSASGGSARIPKDNLTMTTVVSMRSGGSVYVPKTTLVWTDKTLRTTGGRSVYIPHDVAISWVDKTPRVSTGAYVGINVPYNMDQNIGTSGDSVTSEFTTSEGQNVQIVVRAADRITLDSKVLSMRSGGSARIPYDTLAITEQRVEIGARRRRLKTSAIAS